LENEKMKKSFIYYEHHADICSVFSHPKRLLIIDTLRDREMNVTEIGNLTGISKSNLSQHLGLLKDKGVVKTRKEGTQVFYRIAHPNIIKAFDLMSEFILDSISDSQKLFAEEK